MAHRVFNFNPGPSTLPLPVLEKVQEELLDYRGSGIHYWVTPVADSGRLNDA